MMLSGVKCGVGYKPLARVLHNGVRKRGMIIGSFFADQEEKSHKEKKLIRFTPSQFYLVVSDIAKYHEFVPYCKGSKIIGGKGGTVDAELKIGNQYLEESYVSHVSMSPPKYVKAIVNDSPLFQYLVTNWELSPGDEPNSCIVDFSVSFKFKKALHAKLVDPLFDKVTKTMLHVFEERCNSLYQHKKL